MTMPPTPVALAVTSVHPDYLETCLKGCYTGMKHPPKLEPGTITLLRKTTGGLAGKRYGVVGIWWYTGQATIIRSGDYRWPRRWSYRVQFEPLVLQFNEPFCEMFTEPMPDAKRGMRGSSKIPGLVYTGLQGSLIRIKDPDISTGYLYALLKEKASELTGEAEYRGQTVRVNKLLSHLAALLAKTCQPPRHASVRS